MYLDQILIELLSQYAGWKFTSWLRVKVFHLFLLMRSSVPLRRANYVRSVSIIHKSSYFVVVDKPYDMLINSDNPSIKFRVDLQLKELFPSLANEKLGHGFHFVHRLDYSTSGVLCIALDKKAAGVAGEAFSSRLTRKYYIALVRGHVTQELIDIIVPIGFDTRPEHSHMMCTGDKPYCKGAKLAHTRLLTLEKGHYKDGYPATKVLLRPITGRRHQLRIHCSLLGHTIVGDYTYSHRKDVGPPRMFLHSHRLVLPSKIEDLDVCAGDLFETREQFVPRTSVNPLSALSYAKIDSHPANLICKIPGK